MNIETVIEKFSVIANLEITEVSPWISTCQESIDEIKLHLKENVDEEKEENLRRLETAAAALAMYKYVLYKAAVPGAEYFSAGELKVKSDPGTSVKMAYRLWLDAKNSISDLLIDDGFVFERIAFDD